MSDGIEKTTKPRLSRKKVTDQPKDTTLESKPTTRKRIPKTPKVDLLSQTVASPEQIITPPKEDVQQVLNNVFNRNDMRTILASMLPILNTNDKRDHMSLLAQSVVDSFDKYKSSMENHITTTDVEFTVELNESTKTIDSIMFTEQIAGGISKNPMNVQMEYFNDLYKKSTTLEIPKRYQKHEYVEYKYNVAGIVQYYQKRFPELIDLFDVFSDVCLNKSDIGVFIEFSDDFIRKFFIDEYQKKIEEQQQLESMLAEQSMGIGTEQPPMEEGNIFGDQEEAGSQYDTTDEDLLKILNLFNDETAVPEKLDSTTSKTTFKTIKSPNLFDSDSITSRLRKSILQSSIFDQTDDVFEDDTFNDETAIDYFSKQIRVYDIIYDSVVYQYQQLVSKVERKIRETLDNQMIKKIKFATKTADIYGYSILTISKSDPTEINIYNPTEIRLYKKKKSNLDMDNFIFGKVETDTSGNQKLKILNHQFFCYVLSLDPMVMMPIPNIVKISWYLYLLDLVEILVIYNDLLKSKTIHLVEIPIFDPNSTGYDDGSGGVTTTNVTDNLALMNMIINNIESKLVMDTELIRNSQNQSDVAMQVLKNVGLSVAYVPKLSEKGDIKDTKLETNNNDYDKLYGMLNEKIFAVLKFPLWFRTSATTMATFKAIPREVVQFAHMVFMSRVNSALSELEAFVKWYIDIREQELVVSYFGSDSVIQASIETIRIKIRSMLSDFLFQDEKTETARSAKVQNILTMTSAGYTLNPHWVCEYVFPEWTMADVILDTGTALDSKRKDIEAALTGYDSDTEVGTDESATTTDLVDGEDTAASEQAPVTESNKIKINWNAVRKSVDRAMKIISNNKNISTIDKLKNHTFTIKRV